MTLGIAGLISAYITIAIVLLSINLYSKWSWQVKAITIIITSMFYVISYFSFPPLLGWATDQALPQQFRLIAAHIKQPDKESGADGEIFLWLIKVKNLADENEPRAYAFDYSESLHEIVIKAQLKLDKGIDQLGQAKESDDETSVDVDEQRQGLKSVHIEFYDMPDPLFPDK